MKHMTAAATALMLATPLAAQDVTGDADAGAASFDRQCVACHIVADDGGEVLAGRNARTGPNLFEVVGAAPGSRHEFAYSDPLKAYGESGAIWEEDNMTAFLQDPSGHLRAALDDPRARSKMAYRVRSEDDARDIYAFLAQYGVADADGDAPAQEAAAGQATAGQATAGQATAGQAAPDAAAQDSVAAGGPDAPSEEDSAGGDAHDLTPDMAAGEALYQESCRSCHGPTARGMASFPRLAGKDADFLITRLAQYKAGERVGPSSGLMIPVAQELSEQDIADVSHHIATTYQ